MSHLVDAAWVIENLSDPDLIIFDATFVLPTMKRDAAIEFEQTRIAGAQFFDIDKIADPDSDLPHMVPSPALFAEMMQKLGLCNHHKVLVYDNSPFLSAARAWWLLRLFGKENVFVLNGGLPSYVKAGGKTDHGKASTPPIGDFTASAAQATLILFDDLRKQIENGASLQIIDARPEPRFLGEAPEPRAGLRSGHMPGALNVPVTNLLDAKTGHLKPNNDLKMLFTEAGLDFDKPAITSCGSGVTAAGLTLALAELGKYDISLYDGSWAEWGASDAPIE